MTCIIVVSIFKSRESLNSSHFQEVPPELSFEEGKCSSSPHPNILVDWVAGANSVALGGSEHSGKVY